MISEDTQSPDDNPSPGGSDASPSSSPTAEQKREISRWVADGMGLSEIQKKINEDFGLVMTYMDVRFLVDDLDLTLVDEEEEVQPDDSQAENLGEPVPEDPVGGESSVQVELDTVTPPGAMASGTVVFSDGETKKWTLDQFGRLALSGGSEGYKPSEEDVVEFQKELDSALRGKGF